MYYKNLTRIGKSSKTLSFELVPVSQTVNQTIKDFFVLEYAKQRADMYPRAKQILDKFFRDKAEAGLAVCRIPDEILEKLTSELAKYKKMEDNTYFNAANEARRCIVDSFRSLEGFDEWGKGKTSFIADVLSQDPVIKQSLKEINTGIFGIYCTNRALMFSPNAKSGACAHRIIGDNLPKYLKNADKLIFIKEKAPKLYKKLQTQAQILGFDLDSYLKPASFNDCISTVGNAKYNMLIGGFSREDGQKVQGLNELINLYRQQEDSSLKIKLDTLFKNISAEGITFSFVSSAIEDDSEVYQNMDKTVALYPEIEKLVSRLENIGQYDPEKVFVSGKDKNYSVQFFSMRVFGSAKKWDRIQQAIYDTEVVRLSNGKKVTKKIEKEAEKIANADYFDLKYLNDIIEGTKINGEVEKSIFSAIRDTALDLKVKTANAMDEYERCFKNKKAKSNTEPIKKLLDCFLDLCRFIAAFNVPAEYDTDSDFYDEAYVEFASATKKDVSHIYDRIRNYLTQVFRKESKITVNFGIENIGKPQFGWDFATEEANKTMLLRKNGKMYLAIYASDAKINPETCPAVGDDYEKLMLKNFGSPEKQFPRCLFARTAIGTSFEPSKELVAAYTRGKESGKKGEFFKPEFDSIESYNKALASAYLKMTRERSDWEVFDFKLRDSYDIPQDLFDDIATQGYTMSYVKVGAKKVDELVESGKIFMFEIANKDTKSGHDEVSKNLFSVYWDYLFSDENIKDPIIKLGGGMSITFRQSNGESDRPHRKGSYLVNKVAKTGLPIPPAIYQEIYKQANGMLKEISQEAEMWKKVATIKVADHDIIMGKRYSEDKFFMNCPIQFNPFARDVNLNKIVLSEIKKEKGEVNFLGVKRGIRNLIYITVVNPEGKVLYQKSLNKIRGSYNVEFDYHAKLDAVEKSRMEARKNWQEIDTIKNLKHGYLSAAVPEIIRTALKYNAVIVLENLTDGFVSKSAKIEKNIYQDFEKALLSKLELYVDKSRSLGEEGSISNPLTLGNSVMSYDDIRGQNGISLYVTPSFTASVDPVTGFTSLFDTHDITNHGKRLEFLSQFDKIAFRGTGNEICFDFTFNYKNFRTYKFDQIPDKTWTVTSEGERGSYRRNESGKMAISIIHPSVAIKNALDKVDIKLTSDVNLVKEISRLGDSKVEIEAVREIYDGFFDSLRMVNLDKEGNEYFTSCVVGDKGRFSTKNYTESSSMPCEPDSIGAYLIALKGRKVLYAALEEAEDAKHRFFLSKEDWLKELMG